MATPATRAPVAIKICGLTSAIDAHEAVRCGAQYLGVIFAGGPRVQTAASATEIYEGVDDIARVGVFGSQSDDEIVSMVDQLRLDVIQLHSVVDAERVHRLRRRTSRVVWPVVRVDGPALPSEAVDLAQSAGWLLLDSKVSGQLGGSGVAFDWVALSDSVTALRRGSPGVRIVLAGGLRADNVQEGIRLLAPDVVDVSSGVERAPGVKDHDALHAFTKAVSQSWRGGDVDAV